MAALLSNIHLYADVMELADMQDLGSCASACRFNPCHPHQIRTSRLIETLRFLSFISVSKKPFACAVFGIHRVKVLLCDNDFSLPAAHFLRRICLKISVSIKKWNRKILPRPFVSIVYTFVSTVRLFVSKVWFWAQPAFP